MVISTTDKTFECPRIDLIGPGKTARDLSNVTPTLRLKQIHLPPQKNCKQIPIFQINLFDNSIISYFFLITVQPNSILTKKSSRHEQ